jgi:hypothetical protein
LCLAGKTTPIVCTICPLLSSLDALPFLAYLDVSFVQIGDDGYGMLAELVRNNQALQTLVFDECGCTSWTTILQILEAAESRSFSMMLMYPRRSIHRLIERNACPLIVEIKR